MAIAEKSESKVERCAHDLKNVRSTNPGALEVEVEPFLTQEMREAFVEIFQIGRQSVAAPNEVRVSNGIQE